MATLQLNQRTLTGAADLIRILPTGTVFLFQFLSPVLTNRGQCHPVHRVLISVLVLICGLSCFFSSFTDSYVRPDGTVQWVRVTFGRIRPAPASAPQSVDLKAYKLQIRDCAHALFSVAVFAVLVVTDSNIVQCFFPSLAVHQKALLQALPPAVGALASVVFLIFPNTRHGIGYHSTATTTGVQRASSG